MDLIILKILKQHPLVLQKKDFTWVKDISTTEIESTEKNIQNSHTTDMTTAESSKHYLR